MSLSELPPTLELPARDFATAWKNVSMVSSDDAERIVLYRSVFLEVFAEDRVRMVATDSYALLRCWVSPDGNDENEPGLDEVPSWRIVVSDPHKRMDNLASWLLKVTKKEDPDYERLMVTLDVQSSTPETAPPLTPEIAKTSLVVEAAGVEKVWLPIIDGEFPDWRSLWPREERAIESTALAPHYLGLFGKVQGAHDGSACRFYFTGQGKMTRIDYSTWPRLQGILMPVVNETERVANQIERWTQSLNTALVEGDREAASKAIYELTCIDPDVGEQALEDARVFVADLEAWVPPDVEPVVDPLAPVTTGLFAVPDQPESTDAPVVDVPGPDDYSHAATPEPTLSPEQVERMQEILESADIPEDSGRSGIAADIAAEAAADKPPLGEGHPLNSVDAPGSYEAQAAALAAAEEAAGSEALAEYDEQVEALPELAPDDPLAVVGNEIAAAKEARETEDLPDDPEFDVDPEPVELAPDDPLQVVADDIAAQKAEREAKFDAVEPTVEDIEEYEAALAGETEEPLVTEEPPSAVQRATLGRLMTENRELVGEWYPWANKEHIPSSLKKMTATQCQASIDFFEARINQ